MDGLDKQALGARVAEVRRAHGLSQEQLAERLLVSRQTISNWERGKTLVDVESLARMADALGLTLAELLGEKTVDEARRACDASRGALGAIYGALALLWVPALTVDALGRVSPGFPTLPLLLALLVVTGALQLWAWRIERRNNLRDAREVVAYVDRGERPAERKRLTPLCVLGRVARALVVYAAIDAALRALLG